MRQVVQALKRPGIDALVKPPDGEQFTHVWTRHLLCNLFGCVLINTQVLIKQINKNTFTIVNLSDCGTGFSILQKDRIGHIGSAIACECFRTAFDEAAGLGCELCGREL